MMTIYRSPDPADLECRFFDLTICQKPTVKRGALRRLFDNPM
jgi:hypothetical protein